MDQPSICKSLIPLNRTEVHSLAVSFCSLPSLAPYQVSVSSVPQFSLLEGEHCESLPFEKVVQGNKLMQMRDMKEEFSWDQNCDFIL